MGPNGRQSLRVVGETLTAARLAAGMSLQDVVDALADGCNKSSVSRWEQGTLIPSQERILKLVVIFKRGDFVTGKEEEKDEQ